MLACDHSLTLQLQRTKLDDRLHVITMLTIDASVKPHVAVCLNTHNHAHGVGDEIHSIYIAKLIVVTRVGGTRTINIEITPRSARLD